MSVTKRQGERLMGLLLIGFIAINYPLLALFSKTVLWFGIPALYFYLFVFWALFIALSAAVMEKREPSGPDTQRTKPGDTD
jgi:fatty acid desaturase